MWGPATISDPVTGAAAAVPALFLSDTPAGEADLIARASLGWLRVTESPFLLMTACPSLQVLALQWLPLQRPASVIWQPLLHLVQNRCQFDLERAGTERQQEFIATRLAAHTLLESMLLSPPGSPANWLQRGVDRAPRWPERVIGSLSHSCHYAVVVASSALSVAAVGIDIERCISPQQTRVISPCLLSVAELQRLQSWCAEGAGSAVLASMPVEQRMCWLMTLVFSAKESLFKALFPTVQQYFDYREADIVAFDDISCVLQLQRDLGPTGRSGQCFRLGWQCHWPAADMLVSWLVVPATGLDQVG